MDATLLVLQIRCRCISISADRRDRRASIEAKNKPGLAIGWIFSSLDFAAED